jgi:hypothetical protein
MPFLFKGLRRASGQRVKSFDRKIRMSRKGADATASPLQRQATWKRIYLSGPELEGALSVAIGSECGLR